MCMGNTLGAHDAWESEQDNFLDNNSCIQSPGSVTKCIFPTSIKSQVMMQGLSWISFHEFPSHFVISSSSISSPKKVKEKQCQRMFTLLHNCTHLTHQQGNVENSPSQASTVCELWTFRCSSWIWKRQRNQRSNCRHLLDHHKSKRVPEKHSLQLY